MRRAVLSLLLLLPVAGFGQQVYTWTDSEGRRHYGDRPPAAEDVVPVELDNVGAPTPVDQFLAAERVNAIQAANREMERERAQQTRQSAPGMTVRTANTRLSLAARIARSQVRQLRRFRIDGHRLQRLPPR